MPALLCKIYDLSENVKKLLIKIMFVISPAEDDDDPGAFQFRSPDLDSGTMMKEPGKSYSSLISANTSPVSTLTGSSDVDMCRVLQDSGIYTTGSNSFGSIMSMSEKSTSSLSPVVRRHSLTGKI